LLQHVSVHALTIITEPHTQYLAKSKYLVPMCQYWCCQIYGGIWSQSTGNINKDTHTGTRYVILAKYWMWLPDDGFTWTETYWSSFYNFNYFNDL